MGLGKGVVTEGLMGPFMDDLCGGMELPGDSLATMALILSSALQVAHEGEPALMVLLLFVVASHGKYTFPSSLENYNPPLPKCAKNTVP